MKPFLTMIMFLAWLLSIAQSPALFNYQAVARDVDGHVITGHIEIRFSLLEDSDNGLVRYVETHSVTTDAQGIFAVHIGDGVLISGDMNQLAWGKYQYFIKTEIKTAADADFVVMGTSSLLSVPYAMYAHQSGSELQGGTGIDISNGIATNTGDLSTENELQSLSLIGNQLSISNGNAVTLPAGTAYTEGQGIDINNGIIANTGDLSNNNELQSLQLQGQQLSISNGNSITLPTITYNAGAGIDINGATISAEDVSPTNEIQSLNVVGQQLTITNGNTVNLPEPTPYTAGAGININNHVVTAVDASTVNEIQTLSLNGQQLSLSQNGGTVTLPGGNEHWSQSGSLIYANPLSSRVSIGNDNNFGSKLLVTGIQNEHAGTFVTANGDAGYFTSTNGNALLVASGNVGIGNTTPTHKFEVSGKSYFTSTNGPAIEVGQGNVGIGISNPSARLSIDGNDGIGMSVTSDVNHAIDVRSYGTNSAGYFYASNAPGIFISGGNGLLLFAQQFAAGTPANSQGILLKQSGSDWKMYVDASNDYNWAYNTVLKAYIRDTDGSYQNTSDRAVKKNIQPFSNILAKLTRLQAYTYQYRDAADDSDLSLGFIAQEVEKQFPDLVTEKEGLKTICYDHFAVLSVEAIKEQQVIINDLTERIAALESILTQMTAAEDKK